MAIRVVANRDPDGATQKEGPPPHSLPIRQGQAGDADTHHHDVGQHKNPRLDVVHGRQPDEGHQSRSADANPGNGPQTRDR